MILCCQIQQTTPGMRGYGTMTLAKRKYVNKIDVFGFDLIFLYVTDCEIKENVETKLDCDDFVLSDSANDTPQFPKIIN
jgi:hypothetical protein